MPVLPQFQRCSMFKQLQFFALLVLTVLVTLFALQFAEADVEPAKGRQQWQWRALNDGHARKLDPVEGWELVAVDQGVLYFKRLK